MYLGAAANNVTHTLTKGMHNTCCIRI